MNSKSLLRNRSSSFGDRTWRGSELGGLQSHIRREIIHLFCAMVLVILPVSIGTCFYVVSGRLSGPSRLGLFRIEYTLTDSSKIWMSSAVKDFVDGVDNNRELIAIQELAIEPIPRLFSDPQIEDDRDSASSPVRLAQSEVSSSRASNGINDVLKIYNPKGTAMPLAPRRIGSSLSVGSGAAHPHSDFEIKLEAQQSSLRSTAAKYSAAPASSIPDTIHLREEPFLLDLDRQHEHSSAEGTEHEGPEEETSRISSSTVTVAQEKLQWLEFPVVENETAYLMEPFYRIDKSGCLNVRTHRIEIIKGPPGFGSSRGSSNSSSSDKTRPRLAAGILYEITLASIGKEGKQQCVGGDYFETNLVGPRWKSRPPVLDHNNGTYSIKLQLHPRFAGVHNFTIMLLFANYEGMNRYPARWARKQTVLNLEVDFFVPEVIHTVVEKSWVSRFLPSSSASSASSPIARASPADLPRLRACERRDFDRKYWTGRWTRKREYECPLDEEDSCLQVDEESFGDEAWSRGPISALGSEGWVYSAHCAFRIFTEQEAWQCLSNKWLYFWGDSNMQDTIRNLLNFVLGFNHTIPSIPRLFDESIASPNDGGKYSVRITNIFNGHHEVDKNWEGLSSLLHPEYQSFIRSHFLNDTAPDFIFMNSGLHDGLFWRRIEQFLRDGVEHTWNFWSDVWRNMKAKIPKVIYCSTVAAGGYQRTMSTNPQKMEFYNHLLQDRLTQLNLTELQFIDAFDITYPWHYDHKTNDGVHYGRVPAHETRAATRARVRRKYFVDLMVGQVYLNTICGA